MKDWLSNNKYLSSSMDIDGISYEIKHRINKQESAGAPKILAVCYQPNKGASELTRLFIECIKKFTDYPYELWIIDDNSPAENLEWLDGADDINIVFIRTEPKERGSYSNGVAMEVGSRLIAGDSKYVVTFHSDTVVCRKGWLQYLLSKLDGKVRASGFRLTKERVPEGVLHVCGYLIDFQLYKKLNLSFMPRLPVYDIGDQLIHEFLKKGYGIFAAPNTFDNPELLGLIPESLEIHNINSTRAFNDANEVVYMHLGRGILKTEGKYSNIKKTTSGQWIDYINHYLLSDPELQDLGNLNIVNASTAAKINGGDFFLREFYNKDFIDKEIRSMEKNSNILFLESGFEFNTDSYDAIVYGATAGPAGPAGNPDGLLEKIFANLKNGGIFLATFPFMFNDRANSPGAPDYALYAYRWFSNRLWELGYREVSVKLQGTYRSLQFLIDLEKQAEKFEKTDPRRASDLKSRLIVKALPGIINQENKARQNSGGFKYSCNRLTTGFAFKAIK